MWDGWGGSSPGGGGGVGSRGEDAQYILHMHVTRAGHNFRCPLISPLSVDPLINGTALIVHFENVNLTE
jgi:hypothetical protein